MPPTPSTTFLPSLSFLPFQPFAPQSLENAAVRIELTRLRGLRQIHRLKWALDINIGKNWIDPLEGIETDDNIF